MFQQNKNIIMRSPLPWGWVSLAIIFLISLTGCSFKQKDTLPVYNTADFTPVWLSDTKENTEIHTIAPFTFTDQHGSGFGSKELDGKIYVVDFFFTECPGLCPQLTTNLGKVQQAFKDDSNVMLVSFSVLPDKDSASVLNNYAEAHNIDYDKWRLLTGNRKDIYSLARKSFFADEELGLQLNENNFLHTENVLLIDSQKRIRGIYKGTYQLEIEKLIKEIKELEREN